MRLAGCVAGAVAGLIGVASAEAAFTPISTPASSEDGHGAIFSHVYGGTFTPIGGPGGESFTNGTILAQRVDDVLDTVFLTSGFGATAKAVFANYSQSFGYIPGAGDEEETELTVSSLEDEFVELFDVTNKRYQARGEAEGVVIQGPFRFARNGWLGTLASSLPDDNEDWMDHLVTYQVTTLQQVPSLQSAVAVPVLMLFFEDTAGSRSDWDYQDLVVEVRGATVAGLDREPVPEPATLALAALGVSAMALRRRG